MSVKSHACVPIDNQAARRFAGRHGGDQRGELGRRQRQQRPHLRQIALSRRSRRDDMQHWAGEQRAGLLSPVRLAVAGLRMDQRVGDQRRVLAEIRAGGIRRSKGLKVALACPAMFQRSRI